MTGAPSYVTLNPIAFNGLSLPNNEIAYGTGSGISSNDKFKEQQRIWIRDLNRD